AYNRKEKLKNEVTGADMDPDQKMMRGIEDLMNVEDTERDFFRFRMVSRLTNAMTGGTGHVKAGSAREPAAIDLAEVYKDVYKELHRNLYREMRDQINWALIKRHLEKCSSRADLEKHLKAEGETERSPTRTLIDNLERTYGYCFECAKPIVLYYIEKRAH
ncbi:MAG: hypothetical protein KJ044_17190, partial [Planctomycetes bacterium]|nr:hypothetical protein [Planctomycetota bacterium]